MSEKLSPAEVHLRPSDGKEMCQTCVNFSPPNRCALVIGDVAPLKLCDLYTQDGSGEAVTGPDQGIMDMLGGIV